MTVAKEARDSFVEKKSEFIGSVRPIETEEEALAFVSRIKAEFPAARHIAYAYISRDGTVIRFCDDGEPQGTAGMPILEVMQREGLKGAALTVTRFFGGILLGAGGLTRAYAKAARLAVAAAGRTRFVRYVTAALSCDYAMAQRILHAFSKRGVTVTDTQYTDRVSLSLLIKEEGLGALQARLADLTGGKAELRVTGERYCGE